MIHPNAGAGRVPRQRPYWAVLRGSAAAVGLLIWAGLGGCRTSATADPAPTLARFFVESANARGVTLTLPQSDVRITVNPQPVLTETDIINVEIAQVELGRCLAFQLSPAAARDCYRLTGSHQGRRLVVAINDAPLGARRIDRPIIDGVVMVFVETPDAALPKLVADLKRSIVAVQRELARK